MACLRMALAHRDADAPPLFDLLTAGLSYGTYVPQADGTIRGLSYDPFARYVRAEHGIDAEVHRHLTFHNPSGHTPTTRAATLPTPTFLPFFAHRALTLHLG